MTSEIKVEVIREETIRPSSPTPHHLRSSNLSVFDQLTPQVYVPLLLFYPSNNSDHLSRASAAERSKLLKRSLSETLSHFYPFAGTIQSNDVSICCNDHGATFVEARVNCPMSKILEKPDHGATFPIVLHPNELEFMAQSGTGHLLLVQANFFECGGVAVGLNISHKIIDAYTLCKFINSWAAIALGSANTDHVVPPVEFGAAASLFPPLDFLNSPQPSIDFVKENCITRRYVFDASKIAALKSKAASAAVPNPTRVEVVSALIWKCVMEASRSNSDFARPSVWCQFVNMRKILPQAPGENLLGNLVGNSVAKTEEREVEHDVKSLVSKLRKGLEEFKVKYGNGISREDVFQQCIELSKLVGKVDIDTYCSTSWCRFPFYEADFGWGKPSWMSIPSTVEIKNMISLVDVSDGIGIEVRLTLKDEDMAIIESNQEMLAYASLNPSVV
ncbi:BAHD acyltransferase [Prunus yedoensis var. nudiflora]|uniref:BAHD acyltransferase n=1 Tax=Prunus yedoensis var. nudiflora TaxID=2094558 RepID=A0A315AKG9_PRUYE|nr:BAHD acyltransferase [Prunus yedoensis var. nudiflora]